MEMIKKILPDFVEYFLAIKPSKTKAKDSYIWYPTNFGIYSTKSGYASVVASQETAPNSSSPPSFFNWYRSVWTISTLPKLQFFLWKSIQRALPTRDNLQKRGMLQNTSCIHCDLLETTEHIFLHCAFA